MIARRDEMSAMMTQQNIGLLMQAKDNLDRVLYTFDDSKAGGAIAQQLAGISLELIYILDQVRQT